MGRTKTCLRARLGAGGGGRRLKAVCEVLGAVHYDVAVTTGSLVRLASGRSATPSDDSERLEEMLVHVAHFLPTSGVWALRHSGREQPPAANHMRVYRVIRQHHLLLRRLGALRYTRQHDDRVVAVDNNNTIRGPMASSSGATMAPSLCVTFELPVATGGD